MREEGREVKREGAKEAKNEEAIGALWWILWRGLS
jgi:hypothetical protein